MPDPNFLDTLRSWQNFYFMLGGAAAALLGLMFVALSLGQHLITEVTRHSVEVFAEPNIFYFTTVLLISAVMLVPFSAPVLFAWLMLISGLIVMGRTAYHAYLMYRVALKHGDFNLGDWVGGVILPLIAYILLPVSGLLFVIFQWTLGFALLALGTVLVLIVGIINTWGLVIWIIYQSKGQESP
jgi:hypothetical protein